MPESESILVIEPDDSIRDLLTEYFDGLGYTVSSAAIISEGLELLSGVCASVVVMDADSSFDKILNEIDELMLARPGLRVILITGHPTLQCIIDVLRHGVFDVVIKPFRLADLKDIVARAMLPSTDDILAGRIRQLENTLQNHGIPVPDPEPARAGR